MNSFFSFSKHASALLILAMLAPAIFIAVQPRPAYATIPVADVANASAHNGNWFTDIITTAESIFTSAKEAIVATETTLSAEAETWWSFVKELSLDKVFYYVKQMLVMKLAEMMLNYIKTGFKGGPAYVTNPELYYKDVGDEIKQNFFAQLDKLRSMVDPESLTDKILTDVQQDLEKKAYQDFEAALQPAPGNEFPGGKSGYQAFVTDFKQCPADNPWDCWAALRDPANQPLDTHLVESEGLTEAQKQKLENAKAELAAANGFATVKTCAKEFYRNNAKGCAIALAQIPGKIIGDQLTAYLQSANEELHNAHDFNEVVAAALVDLATGWMNGGSGGSLLDATLENAHWQVTNK